jgi:hypothetical protein
MLNDVQIGEVWTLFSAYIDKKHLDVIAERYVEFLSDAGATNKTLQSSVGVDHWLDHAVSDFLATDDEEEIEDDY